MATSSTNRNLLLRALGAVALLTIAMVGTALFVDRAWQKEARVWELAAKTRHFDIALDDTQQIDAERLGHLEGLVEQIERLSPIEAASRRMRLDEAIAASLRKSLASPRFTEDDCRQFDEGLAILHSRRTKRGGVSERVVEQLKAERDARLAQWNVLFELCPPFGADATPVFPIDQVVADDGQSLLRVANCATDYTPTVVECPAGAVELSVAFDRYWQRASLIGASLNYSDDPCDDRGEGARARRRYDFLIAVPSFDYRDTTPEELAKLPTFEDIIGKRTENRLDVYILRDGLPLRKEAATITSGRLHLVARRLGTRLEFAVNGGEPYAFDDPFPLPTSERGVFAVYWPPQVHIEHLLARTLAIPLEPNPLEQGHVLYVQGKYDEALEVYQGWDTLEAAYKAALCHFALGRTQEFLDRITTIAESSGERQEELRIERQAMREGLPALSSQPSTLSQPSSRVNRWRLLAACRLLQYNVESRDWPQVQEQLKEISDRYSHDQIALAVPAVQHELILQYFRRPEANRSPLFAERKTAVDDLALAAVVEELFGDDPAARRIAKWRLADAYRACEATDEALEIFHELLAEDDLSPFERMALLADVADMLTRNDQPAAAIEEVNAWLLEKDGGYRPTYLPLLVFRAATRISIGEKENAKADLDYFLEHVDVRQVDYSHYAHACGLRGMLHSEEGDSEAALKTWRQGLRRNWHEGYLEPQEMAGLRGFESAFAYNSIVFDGILGSWTGEVTQDEAYRNMWNLYPGSGVFSTSFRKLVEVSFEPEFIREVMKQSSTSRFGKEQGIESLLQHTTPDNALSFVIAFVRISCLSDVEQTPEVEQVLEKCCASLVDGYFEGAYDETDLKDLLNIWRGRFTESSFLRLARKTSERNPTLAASAAFAFGCKYARGGDRDIARYLFEFALSAEEVDPVIERLARQQLERLSQSDATPTP
jgi:tetratricopeptide (TPR) repeat protein